MQVSCQIVKLVLRNNALTTIRGIENLKSLEGLDLSYNIISNFSELELLSGLPSLQNLWLEGNPICSANWYRAQLYSFFSDPDKVRTGKKLRIVLLLSFTVSPFCDRYVILCFLFFNLQLILDDKKISTREVWKRQIIVASRHKQPASFGFYSPVKDDTEAEGSVNPRTVSN